MISLHGPRLLRSFIHLLERPWTGVVGEHLPPNPGLPELAGAAPLPDGRPNPFYDGRFIGGDNHAYPRGTPLEAVPPRMPRNGAVKPGLVVYINGVGQTKTGMSGDLQAIADATHTRTVGLYSATKGFPRDAAQTILDGFDVGDDPAVDAATELLLTKLRAGERLRIMAYSKGAAVADRAVGHAIERLSAEGWSADRIQRAMRKHLSVETLGGAARVYNDGPFWVHYVNWHDPTQLYSGYVFGDDPPDFLVRQGDDQVTIRFGQSELLHAHDMRRIYLPHYVDLDQLRAPGQSPPA